MRCRSLDRQPCSTGRTESTALTLLRLARERVGGYEELICGDAAALPWEARAFGLAVAYMSLQDVDDLLGAVARIARVLEPEGRLCLAIVHPLNRPSEALDDYFREHRFAERFERDGLSMTFEGIDRPESGGIITGCRARRGV